MTQTYLSGAEARCHNMVIHAAAKTFCKAGCVRVQLQLPRCLLHWLWELCENCAWLLPDQPARLRQGLCHGLVVLDSVMSCAGCCFWKNATLSRAVACCSWI